MPAPPVQKSLPGSLSHTNCGVIWKVRGTGASEDPLPLTLKCADHTGGHLHSYRDEPGTPEITEASREAPGKYLKGVKACSYRKTTESKAQLKCLHTNACSTGNEENVEVTKHRWKIMPASWAAPKATEPSD